MRHDLQRIDTAHVLLCIADSIGREIGPSLLEKLVVSLRDSIDASLVIITSGEGDPVKRVHARFALAEDGPVPSVSYDLEGTPCAIVYGDEQFVVPCDLEKRFPIEEGSEGYSGVRAARNRAVNTGEYAGQCAGVTVCRWRLTSEQTASICPRLAPAHPGVRVTSRDDERHRRVFRAVLRFEISTYQAFKLGNATCSITLIVSFTPKMSGVRISHRPPRPRSAA